MCALFVIIITKKEEYTVKKDVVLQPSFYDKFECLGGACRYTCCQKWNVFFTKQEFKNIKRKIHTDEFKELFQDAFLLEKGSDKCKIKFREDDKCKFLSNEGLCKMYTEVGPENMSEICRNFPRVLFRYLDRYDRFLSIGCEQVVNLLLEEKDGLTFELTDREFTKPEIEACPIMNLQTLSVHPEYCLWDDMMALMVDTLQNRNYKFGERIVLLGIAMKKVDAILLDTKQDINIRLQQVKEYAQNFVNEINDVEFFKNKLPSINSDGQKRLMETAVFYLKRSGSKLREKVEKRIDLKRNMQKYIDDDGSEKVRLKVDYDPVKYQQAMVDFEEFMKGKEYWLENVMIEGFLSVKFPFRLSGDFWFNYCAMAMTYSIYLFMLTCCLEKDSTKEDFVYYVVEVARTLFHNDKHTRELEEQLKKTESDSLAHIAVLVL